MLTDTRDNASEACRAPHSFDEPAVQARLVGALRDATGAALIETHISYVLLTGTLAYKIKKAVSLGFLDFRTLSARRFFCEEELRLNRRLAPEFYLDVVPITGTPDAPTLGGAGQPIEYAVRMREFEQHALATRALARGEFIAPHVDALATRIAAFHRAADAAPAGGVLGASSTILRLAVDNFAQLRPLLRTPAELRDLDVLEAWTRDHHAACSQLMSRRLREGFIRECHGDLHLGNIAVVDRDPLIFDCIEFSPEMRWIDVMNEIAFTTMDLEDRGRADLAYRFLNAYLEITGDYEGLGVLRFYLVYRAMVRAKIARLRATQIAAADASSVLGIEYSNYIGRAKALARPPRPALVVMHGCAGSGKTTVSQQLLESAGAVRIRSDVERKRLHGVAPGARHGGGIESGLYTAEATRATYQRTLAQARTATAAGYPTIIDAAFLKAWQRRLFAELAAELRIPFVIVTLAGTPDVLRERIVHRLQGANDASDADLDVLEHQLRTQDPLTAEERADAIEYRTGTQLSQPQSRQRWNEILARLAGAGNVTSATGHRQTLRKRPR